MRLDVIEIYISNGMFFILFQIAIYIWFSKIRKRLNKKIFLAYLITFWFFFLFNVVYTGYFGWNMEPINETEWWLDNISTAGLITSFVMLWQSIITDPKKKDKIANKTN
jgi:NADH:ubiquinone oxidoreductase subunit 6 (subunit J)